jgi:DNA-binding NarL/FixJ family response regulator
MGAGAPAHEHVGRSTDVAALRALVREVAAGQGRAVWVEGEPGIGKSSTAAAGLADAARLGCRTGWAWADEFAMRSPLRVIRDCLAAAQTTRAPDDPPRPRTGPAPPGLTPALAALEELLADVDDLCAATPLILVVDDIQWADDNSAIAWNRLAHSVDQLPLLLVAVCRSSPHRPAVSQLRRSVLAHGATHLPIGPLAPQETTALAASLTGAPPGPHLSRLLDQAHGNPLYTRELLAALLTENRITIGADQAELAQADEQSLPHSFDAVLHHRLATIPAPAREMLAAAAALGPEFTVTDLAATLDSTPARLLTRLRQATAVRLLADAGNLLRFADPQIRQALYRSLPTALRPALHRRIAGVLAQSGDRPEQVAEHLLASGLAPDRWTREWTAAHADRLTATAPRLAADLLQHAADQHARDLPAEALDDLQEDLLTALVRAHADLGRLQDAERLARHVLARTRSTETAAEMRWILAHALDRSGKADQALTVAEEALNTRQLPLLWQARFQALAALTTRTATGDLDTAARHARHAMTAAQTCGDHLAAGWALEARWCIDTARRDHVAALAAAERALAVADALHHTELRHRAVEDRIRSLQNLDRLDEADTACHRALADDRPGAQSARVALHVASAVQDLWRGRWDDTATSLDTVADEVVTGTDPALRAGTPLRFHGLAAFLAGHRDDRGRALQHIDAGLAHHTDSLQDRENGDFLLAAQALEAERAGDPERAAAHLARFLEDRPGQLTPLHQWLPDLVRLTVDLGDTTTARAALDACTAEAAREATPARAAAAADRAQGMVDADPAPVLRAAARYAAAGRPFEQAQALEDAAVLSARQGHQAQARRTYAQTVALYEALGAAWDLRRTDTRLRPHGIRRGVRGPRPKAAFGWEALTPTELKVAHLVAAGKSNPQVAADLFLSRRTVQTHVSHILVKLGVSSRVGIATEALRHTTPDQPGT